MNENIIKQEINIEQTQKVINNGNGKYILIPKHLVDAFNVEGGDLIEIKILSIIKK